MNHQDTNAQRTLGRRIVRIPLARCLCVHVLAALAILVSTARADPPEERVAWLRDHVVKIRSIDPADEDFADLKPVGEAVGDARVVLLGEASHGDGATLLAKSRLLKFLHRGKGFDVLAWESGFYECTKSGQALATGAPWQDTFEKIVPWREVEQYQPTLRYVHSTQRGKRPISVTGMSWYNYADSAVFDEVLSFLAVDPNLPTPEQRAALTWSREFLETLGTRGFPSEPIDPPELEQLGAMAHLIEQDAVRRFRRKHGKAQTGFMRLALENLNAHIAYFHRPPSRGGADDNPIGVQEGRNVLFLVRNYFPSRKTIVWAHSGHLMRGAAQIEDLGINFRTSETVAAGQHIHDALGDGVYSIMFTAYGGKWRDWRNQERDLPVPPQGSLEDLFHRAGLKFAFVDFRGLPPGHWLRERLIARPIAHSPMRADWTQVYDGVFFIDTMTPTTAMKPRP